MSGASHQQLIRFERGQLDRVSIEELGAWCAVVGLDLAVRTYPAGDPLRDRAQLALLERLRVRLHPSLRWRTEVPLPIDGDLLRDDPDGHLILLVSDTRSNRAALATLAPGLNAMLPRTTREILSALTAGREPLGSGIAII